MNPDEILEGLKDFDPVHPYVGTKLPKLPRHLAWHRPSDLLSLTSLVSGGRPRPFTTLEMWLYTKAYAEGNPIREQRGRKLYDNRIYYYIGNGIYDSDPRHRDQEYRLQWGRNPLETTKQIMAIVPVPQVLRTRRSINSLLKDFNLNPPAHVYSTSRSFVAQQLP